MMPLRVGHHRTITIGQAYQLVGVEATKRLTLWILRHHLERNGFSRCEAQHLDAYRWVAVTRGLIGS